MKFINNQSLRMVIIPSLLVAASLTGYLLICNSIYGTGFPLDDAWIHQTYSRNLITYGRWEYIVGEPSAGSTSPLWTCLLTISYLFSIPPTIWTYFIGGLIFIGIILIYHLWIKQENNNHKSGMIFIVGMMTFEWHFCWAALSGMETIAFIFLLLLNLYLIGNTDKAWLLIGLLSGIAVWLRPEALTLLGPIFFVLLLKNQQHNLGQIIRLLIGFALPVIIYLAFNKGLGIGLWPNTYYAKQAEYSSLLNESVISRLVSLIKVQFVGPGVLLIPGVVVYIWKYIKQKDYWRLAPILWWIGFTCIYTLRLPVTYQHGRYLMPAMAVIYLIGLSGSISFMSQNGNQNIFIKTIIRTWQISFVITVAIFYFLGAKAYGEDVAIIESEMVNTSLWISENTSENAVIAAHDIGALGYFSKRSIVDMAGLISPDAIPYINNDKMMAEYVTKKRADYLMTFPDMYPELTNRLLMVFTTGAQFAPSVGGQNMAVYRFPDE